MSSTRHHPRSAAPGAGGIEGAEGSEGRISVVKRRHGLNRCRYKGYVGMNRWVGLGVIADNIVNIGQILKRQAIR